MAAMSLGSRSGVFCGCHLTISTSPDAAAKCSNDQPAAPPSLRSLLRAKLATLECRCSTLRLARSRS
eukprot:scaffold650378_cov45-Prasinocladus_malaysianus.AAC.1